MSIARVKYAVGRNSDPSRDNDIVVVFPEKPEYGDLKIFGPHEILSVLRKGDLVKVQRDANGLLRTAKGENISLELVPDAAVPEPPATQHAAVSPEEQREALVGRIDSLTGWWAVCFDSAKRTMPELSEEGHRAVATSVFIQMNQSGAFRKSGIF